MFHKRNKQRERILSFLLPTLKSVMCISYKYKKMEENKVMLKELGVSSHSWYNVLNLVSQKQLEVMTKRELPCFYIIWTLTLFFIYKQV